MPEEEILKSDGVIERLVEGLIKGRWFEDDCGETWGRCLDLDVEIQVETRVGERN